ncbi:hypothetical protein [Pseudomonas tohonis]|uniref:hypothetical protein n=1 Tax=Pseudomonas TaxID=286 RepID=UPI00039788DF|nr:hypothetical protein [Pseudomonas tohonis]EQM70964.1 hypothetical protein L682_07355 [Pseudomonas alcaligenes OT 69]MDN4146631.1 hypothetical protein [Pseudomonas tohonis]
MNITVKLTAGAYVARARGHKQTASSTESALRAAERLAEKLDQCPDLLEQQDATTFTIQELTDD